MLVYITATRLHCSFIAVTSNIIYIHVLFAFRLYWVHITNVHNKSNRYLLKINQFFIQYITIHCLTIQHVFLFRFGFVFFASFSWFLMNESPPDTCWLSFHFHSLFFVFVFFLYFRFLFPFERFSFASLFDLRWEIMHVWGNKGYEKSKGEILLLLYFSIFIVYFFCSQHTEDLFLLFYLFPMFVFQPGEPENAHNFYVSLNIFLSVIFFMDCRSEYLNYFGLLNWAWW